VKNIGAWAAAAAGALLISACGHSAAKQAEKAPEAKVEEAGNADVVKVARPEQFPVEDVNFQLLRNELNVNGSVSPDVSRTVPVNALLSGRVTAIRARLGDQVTKGQVLLNVVSPDLEMAFADYQKFQADEVLTRKALERAKLLYEHGALPEKDVETAQDAEDKAKVDVKSAAARIHILGGDPAKASSQFEVIAPISGTITNQNTTAAATVKTPDNSPDLFTISDLSAVWVLCDVFENDLALVHLGDSAQVKMNAYPDRTFKGRVSNIGQVLDPATRTAKVRLEMENSHHLLKPGMFATVTFFSQKPGQRAVIPATAILRLHDRSWVFRPDGDKQFRRVEIQPGIALPDGQQEVLSGLSRGDKIVKNALELSNAADQT
jgi:cobalt-zinc-cadmium efflux system membrane fusion protein